MSLQAFMSRQSFLSRVAPAAAGGLLPAAAQVLLRWATRRPFQVDMEPTLEGIQHMLDFLSATIPAAKTAKPEQFIDRRLLDQLPKP